MTGRLWGSVVLVCMLASAAFATPPLDKPAFTATAAELQSLAKGVARGADDVVVLREENDVSYDERGRITARWRLVFFVATQAGVDDWNTLTSSWHPSYQDKPTLRARVVDANGRVVELDPSKVTDEPYGAPATAQRGDRRRLEAPLPPLSVGAIVEEEITTVDREPLLGGASFTVGIANSGRIASVRVKFSAPVAKKLKLVAHGLPAGTKPSVEKKNGRETTSYSLGPFAAPEGADPLLPGDARPYRYLLVSPATSWSAVARDYRAVIDKRISEGPVTPAGELPKTASLESARAIVAWLHKHVRPNSVGLDDASIVPSTPADVIKRGHASSLDMATTLAAFLRQAGMRADLALLSVGPGPDVDREVPAIDVFDHVIVRARIGKQDVWIDPLEPLMRIGVLPAHDQGRNALVIGDGTTALTTTPINSAADNVVRETRTYELAEAGNAKVTEVSRESGVFEADQRRWIRDSSPEAVHKDLTNYGEAEFRSKRVSYSTTAADDLGKPFEVTVVIEDSMRGYSGHDDIDVYLFPTDALKKLPKLLRDPGTDPKPRKQDLWLPAPHIYEIESRLVVPVGFTVPVAASDKTRELGPFKLVEKQRVEGRTLIVTFRLEAAKQRLTPAEVAKVQQALRALGSEEAMHIVFPQSSLVHAFNGKHREAIADANALIKLHPREALHQQQLAHVLIKAGAGAAARRAARKATELEPKSANAHVVLAWVLQHDTFGDWLGFDHDRAGALAALQKARKLDPNHVGAASDLAEVLERNPQGRRFDLGCDLRAAIDAWRAARALDDTSDKDYGLALALAWAGEAAEAENVLRSMKSEERRDQLLIVTSAMTAGTEAAIRFAGTLGGGATRAKHLAAAGGMLLLMRRYDAARAVFAEANALQAGTAQATLVQRIKRSDKSFKSSGDARDVALEMTMGQLYEGRKSNVYWDNTTRDELQEQGRKGMVALRRTDMMTLGFIEDILRSASTSTVEGDAGLWRVESDIFGAKSQVYVATDRGAAKVVGSSETPRGAARHVLRLLAKNDEKSALRLLDWLAKDLAGRARTDMLAHMFGKLWGGSLPKTRVAMEVAAAALAGTTDAARAVPILAKCKPTTVDGQLACDGALAEIYDERANWTELEEHAREWSARAPKQLTFPLVQQSMALARLARFDDADRVVADALVKHPDDRDLVYAQANVMIARGKLPQAVKRLEPLTEPGDLNNVAWLKLAEATDLKGALALARQGVQARPNEPHVLNTLAAIEAELGELGEAKQHLAKSVEVKGLPRPGDADLYVQGRILEQLGLRDDAIAIYRQIKPSISATFTPDAVDLARRRLEVLGVKK